MVAALLNGLCVAFKTVPFIFMSTTFAIDCLRILISPPLFVIFSARALKIWGFQLVWSYICMAKSLKKVPVSSQNIDTCSHFLQTPGTSRDMEGVVHTLLEEVM